MSSCRRLWKNDMLWNALGSLCYALASMVLAFMVIRISGKEEGGIFGFGFSTLGQQIFIIAYFGLRPFHVTDMGGRYSFGEFLRLRRLTAAAALLAAAAFVLWMYRLGAYSLHKSLVLLLLSGWKVLDACADVYESELQRQGRLYRAGQSLCFRTLLSVCSLLLALLLSGSLFPASFCAVLSQLFGTWLFAERPLRRCPEAGEKEAEDRAAVETERPGIRGVDWGVRRGASGQLLRETLLLFISVFLDFYVFSAAKYAVDGVLGSEASGMFNILFMPSSLIYLLAGFLIRPMLTRLASEYENRELLRFRKSCRFLNLSVLLLTAGILFSAFLLGELGLSVFEALLGFRYQGALRQELPAFLLLIGAGGLYALANVQYYILVILREQSFIFLGYLLSAAAAAGIALPLVKERGILGAALCNLLLMTLLLLLFGFFLRRRLRREFRRQGMGEEQK